MASLSRVLARSLLLGSLAPACWAQTVLYTFDGNSSDDFFGSSVSAAGDVNRDGWPDLIVGGPGDNAVGSARVLSGLDGSLLYTFAGDAAGHKLGIAVGGAGDVNGDGYDDLIVGAPGADANGASTGLARVFSGADGSTLFTFVGDDAGDRFGSSVAGAGDVNGDGHDDLVVGAPFDDDNGVNAGRVRVFSGQDGSVLHTFDGDGAGDAFGASVDGGGDVDGDGFDDVIVGAPLDDDFGANSGSARVLSGLLGGTLYTFRGDSAGDQLGNAVAVAGQVNGDGRADLIVGARGDDAAGAGAGAARVFSGLDGAVLHTFVGAAAGLTLGRAVSGAGDVDRDGFADLIVGDSQDDGLGGTQGSARVFSGIDGTLLHLFTWHTPGDSFGRAVGAAGDVDGDGYDDLIVGDSHDGGGGPNSGSASVFSGRSLVGVTYCSPAVSNSSGDFATLQAFGSAAIADDLLFLTAFDLPPDQFGYFNTSQTQGFVQGPGSSQGNLCLGGAIGRYVDQVQSSGPAGRLLMQVDLGDMPPPVQFQVQPGETWNFQAWYRDDNPGPTSNFTDAVAVTFQ